MADKSIKTRVQMKRGSEADWIAATNAGFKPLEGEYIFYSDLNKTKVGKKDASGNLLALDELDFLDARDADTLDGKHASEFALKADLVGAVEYKGTVSASTGLSTTAGKGDFYRVSTQFTYGSETAHVGDILIATKDNPSNQNTTDWDLIHTEVDSNTWVENKVNAAGYVTAPGTSNANKVWKTDGSGNPGWRDDANTVYTHPNSGVTAGTYSKVTVNAQGHVTGGSNPTTLSGYGITDAYTKTEVANLVAALISSGTADPTASTASLCYFKYN